jgi:hypothetical protein
MVEEGAVSRMLVGWKWMSGFDACQPNLANMDIDQAKQNDEAGFRTWPVAHENAGGRDNAPWQARDRLPSSHNLTEAQIRPLQRLDPLAQRDCHLHHGHRGQVLDPIGVPAALLCHHPCQSRPIFRLPILRFARN